jgi:hypothetical protein
MAWTKTKAAIVTSFAVLLLIGPAVTIVEQVLPAPDIQGAWIATYILGGYGVKAGERPKTRLVLRIASVDGVYQVSEDNIDQGFKNMTVSNFTYRHRHIHAEFDGKPDSFDGIVNHAGTKVSGKWEGKWPESTFSGPLVFRRTTNPPAFPEPLTYTEFTPRADSVLQGLWKGLIRNGNGGTSINVKVAELANGTFRADFYCPDQGAVRQPTSVSFDKTTVKIMPMAGYGMFKGELRKGGWELAGDWIQNGQRSPATLTRAN